MTEAWAVLLATLAGGTARWLTLRIDYRQYPSYPQGFAIHLALGFVAAFLGALALPALLAREYAAASFLALAATQFREVRKIEREALTHLEETELVHRGSAYIEGIARVFEARNYVTMLTAVAASAALVWARPPLWAGVLVAVAMTGLTVATVGLSGRGLHVGDVAAVRPAQLEFQGPLLVVEGTVLLNVGRAEAREAFRRDAFAFVVEPKDLATAATLASPGQRQAILHDLAAQVGVRMDVDEPEFAPVARRRVEGGGIVVVLLPAVRDPAIMMEAIARVPLLESAVRMVGRPARLSVVPSRLGEEG